MGKTRNRNGNNSPLRSINIERNSNAVKASSGWSLDIVTHPNHIFYKDEGGKANHLWGVLRIVRKDGLVASFDEDEVKRLRTLFRFVLCFASKRVVEDGEEIFSMREVAPQPTKSSEWKDGKASEFVFKFRIDKVSRRKDGQHFSVRCELKRHESILDGSEVGCCYTSPVNVLSKRKSRVMGGSTGRPRSNSMSSNSSSRSSTKRARTSRKDAARLDAVLRRLDKVESEVARLKQKNAMLERAHTKVVAKLKRLSKPPSMNSLFHDPADFEDVPGSSFEDKCANVFSPEGPSAVSFGQYGTSSDMSPLNATGKVASSLSADMPSLKRAGALSRYRVTRGQAIGRSWNR